MHKRIGRWLSAAAVVATGAAAEPVGVVSHVKVLSDKVADVSSLAEWRRSFIREGMTDEQKMVAAWKSSCEFVYQDAPPVEYLHEACVHDAIKEFNVYGYGMCCCASSRIEEFARYLGLPARGWAINGHSVPEVSWGGGWHLLDASLLNYFVRADGAIASLDDVERAVQDWLPVHPDLKGNRERLTAFHRESGWTGWKRGPELLARCPFYDAGGWWPAKTHGWSSTMQEYDGSKKTPFPYEYGYAQGYEVNNQLRRGERLTRNWFHHGLHVNGVAGGGDAPGCLNQKIGEGSMAFLRGMGDLNDGRIGSGTLEYEVPLADGSFRDGALAAENLANGDGPRGGIRPQDPARPGRLEIGMPSSYVYLDGKIQLRAALGAGGAVRVLLSGNHGLDWREIAVLDQTGEQEIDIGKSALRRYDYRLKLVLEGAGTSVDRLRIAHSIQCSQRALPTLARGPNRIRFSAGPAEGRVTLEGCTQNDPQGGQVAPLDFHPVLDRVAPRNFALQADGGSVTFPVATPGEMTRLQFSGHCRLRDARDSWDMQVSFDGGKTFQSVKTQTGPCQGVCAYVEVSEIPPGTRQAQVRWVGTVRNTTCLFLVRIDADYRQPHGGFAPVKVTYVWEEDGAEKRDVHVARSAAEEYTLTCAAKPAMKSIILERAD